MKAKISVLLDHMVPSMLTRRNMINNFDSSIFHNWPKHSVRTINIRLVRGEGNLGSFLKNIFYYVKIIFELHNFIICQTVKFCPNLFSIDNLVLLMFILQTEISSSEMFLGTGNRNASSKYQYHCQFYKISSSLFSWIFSVQIFSYWVNDLLSHICCLKPYFRKLK